MVQLNARRANSDPSRREPTGDVDVLMHRTAAGDAVAFADLYEALAPAVFGLTRRVLRDPAMAEEATQEVMLGVWRDAGAYDPARGSARGWVLTMAHRRAVDRVRSEAALRRRQQHHVEGMQHAEYDEVTETVHLNEEHLAVRGLLGALTPRQREAVVLVYFDGCTYRDAAERLDVPVSTLKARVHEALCNLRRALADNELAPAV